MNIVIERKPSDAVSALGELFIDGKHECYTLELPWRNNQHNISCIPALVYDIIITYSVHLQELTPELLDVPDRADIRMHVANWPTQILGCIGIGDKLGSDAIYESRIAFDRLLGKIKAALSSGQVVRLRIESTTPDPTQLPPSSTSLL